MPITMTTFAGSTVTPKDDAMIYDAALGMNGILNGCMVRISGNNVVVGNGYAVICGRHLNVTEETIPVELASATSLKGRVYIHMDLQSGTSASDVAELRVERAEVLSMLQQDVNVNFNNGIYEYELATFDITTTSLTNLVYTAKRLSSLREIIGDPNELGPYASVIDGIRTLGKSVGDQLVLVDTYATDPDSQSSVTPSTSRIAASGKAVYNLYNALSRSISSGLTPIMLDSGVTLDFDEQPYTLTGIWGFNQNNALAHGPFTYNTADNLNIGGWLFTISTDNMRSKQIVLRLSTNAAASLEIYHRTVRPGQYGATKWTKLLSQTDYDNFTSDLTFAKSNISPQLFYYSDGTNKTTLIGDNGTNIWIGANATTDGHHHIGGTYISSGYNKTNKNGNATAYISVPDAQNNDAKNYGIWHTGNAKCVTVLKETVLRNAGTSNNPYRIYARDGIFGDNNHIVLNTGNNGKNVYLRGGYLYVQNTDHSAYVEAKAKKWNTDSSRLVKENVEDITESEAKKLLELRPVSFNYRKEFTDTPEENNYGLIAEETLEIIPEAVSVPDGYDESEFDASKGIDNKILSIDYSKFVPHLIKMTQIQQKKIDELEARLARLEAMDGNV